MKRVAGLWLVLALMLAGCAHWPLPSIGQETYRDGLIAYAEKLATLDADALSHQLPMAQKAYVRQKSPITAARLGLALGQPDYPGYDPEAARQYLKAAMTDQAADWSAHERAFLSLRVHQIRQWTATRSAMRQNRRELARENQRLRRKLQGAKRKLHAITEIEQDIGHRRHNR